MPGGGRPAARRGRAVDFDFRTPAGQPTTSIPMLRAVPAMTFFACSIEEEFMSWNFALAIS
jgi:hypothetical protein